MFECNFNAEVAMYFCGDSCNSLILNMFCFHVLLNMDYKHCPQKGPGRPVLNCLLCTKEKMENITRIYYARPCIALNTALLLDTKTPDTT